jgi:hypothetical protein
MAKIFTSVTQGGADTASSQSISTGLTADGKSGWEISAIEAYWVNGETVPAADWELDASVTTVNSTFNFSSLDVIGALTWALQNTGGVAVAVPFEPIKRNVLLEPRLTVQPTIYCRVDSTLTGIANNVIFAVYYEIVKLTDIEVLRLLQGGA